MKVLGVIPARFGAVRFPGKALAPVLGKPMVQWVWEQALKSTRLDRLLVATDDRRILEAVQKFGGEAVMTSSELSSGTDRVWAAAKETGAELILNIQGDEPLLQPAMVDRLIQGLLEDPAAQMVTLRFLMKGPDRFEDPNVVKVVVDGQDWALYFSRALIPGLKAGRGAPAVWYKHLGIYGYRRQLLERFVSWAPSPLETTEGLEQLRALEHGVRIKVFDSPQDTSGVDTPEDLRRVEQVMKGAGLR